MAYLIGSISSAIVVCRLMGLADPRTTGSKNPGATNVLRSGNKLAAILTLAGDLFKGLIPVLWAAHLNYSELWMGAVMCAVVLGHMYPVFFGFKGGKGVATAAGAFLGLDAVMGFVLIITWLLIIVLFRIAALGAVIVALIAPFYVLWALGLWFAIPVGIISLFIIWRHRANIHRIWQGTEPKIGGEIKPNQDP
jgi:glycerol-3-phosphate acyltransferase PlsY